jgi:hypothetical protein
MHLRIHFTGSFRSIGEVEIVLHRPSYRLDQYKLRKVCWCDQTANVTTKVLVTHFRSKHWPINKDPEDPSACDRIGTQGL